MERQKVNSQELRIARDIIEAYRNTLIVPSSTIPEEIQRALNFIHQHLFTNSMSVEWLIECCKLGSGISGRFHYHVGMSPKVYIIHYRMLIGKKLLTDSSLISIPIQSIAILLGFSGNGSFTHAFKKYIGIPPNQFRIHNNNLSS